MITDLTAGDPKNTADPSSKTVLLSTRILSLDVLRGIAVMAGLLVSIWVFGGFSNEQQKQLLLLQKGWNYRIFATLELLLNGKMRALIAIVFGASMVLFLHKDREEGKGVAGDVFINRQLWLIVLGILNAVLFLWTQDVLFHLGIMGILLFPFIRLSPRGLLIAAIIITLIYCGKYYWDYADDKKMHNKYATVMALENKFKKDSADRAKNGISAKKDTLTKLQKQDKSAWEGRLSSMKLDLKKDSPNIKGVRSGNYGKVWNHLLPAIQSREADWTYRKGVWDFAGMIFLGMFLYKIAFFNNRFSRNKTLLLGLVCLAGGLLMGLFRLYFQQTAYHDYLGYINRYSLPYNIFFPFERALVALAYCGFVIVFLSSGILKGVWVAFAAAGKLALSNYLMQSILCTIYFYGYGMGYYGRLSQLQLYFFAGEIILVQMVCSVVWLKYFRYGPAEWLLRQLSAGKRFLPSKKSSSLPNLTD